MEQWQTGTIAVINIIAIVVSPIIALLISNKIQNDKEKRNDKLWILKILMTQRGISQDVNYVNALNLIDLIFVDSQNVRDAYKNLYNEYCKNSKDINFNNITLYETKLIETIVNDIGYKDKITWDNIQQPYKPNWLREEVNAKQNYNNLINYANIMLQAKQKEDMHAASEKPKVKKGKNNEQ